MAAPSMLNQRLYNNNNNSNNVNATQSLHQYQQHQQQQLQQHGDFDYGGIRPDEKCENQQACHRSLRETSSLSSASRDFVVDDNNANVVNSNGNMHNTSFTSTKGLLNGPGQNNCFLNSAVQVLWHLDIFRRSFRDLSGHACMADSCIFCALKELFSQLQFSNETALPPDALRRALAESFFDQQRFQLGFMDDAAECFENMLMRIHAHIAHGEAEDMCNARHCIPHQKFAMTLVEQSACKSCGATSEPLSYTQMVHYVSTSTLVYQARGPPNGTGRSMEPFGQLLRKAGNMGDVRVCPSACGAVIQIGRTLMNRPEIVSIGLVWNSERPTLEHIMEVFSSIGTTLRLGDVFNTVVDTRWADSSIHTLVGVVTYYGKHYSTFFFHTKLRLWIYFDDATVREVGPRWDQVVEKCKKGRYQPLLLLYALPDGTPVNTENAPKVTTQFEPSGTAGGTTKSLRRSITPSPEKPNMGPTRRAITPNPDFCGGTTANSNKYQRPYNEYQNLSVIQNSLRGVDTVDSGGPKAPVHRTLSNGSSSGTEGLFRDYPNVPRTRDSGNWSSDRNSASSGSSNGENYQYYPNSGTNGGASTDVGYDSYSLSSNDSSTMTTLQHLMKMGHLAKIPEDYTSGTTNGTTSCDVLCDEADELLVKSRQLEDDHDLVLALALCNAAATKARAAMDAPYNNPQTLTLARMKHNTCVMRARSLHRRMSTPTVQQDGTTTPEIRHTRDGSTGGTSNGSGGRHSRQSSRDKSHSRQNSREGLLVVPPTGTTSTKNIEIYATLPKKSKDTKKIASLIMNFRGGTDNDEYISVDKGTTSRGLFSRSKNKASGTVREKRSRSEDRNKMTRDLSLVPDSTTADKKVPSNKKQHKIRRKLMGGLIRRKNRSMPDLTDEKIDGTTMDDSTINTASTLNRYTATPTSNGYLSEGHLEFFGKTPGGSGTSTTNANLDRSKLMMRKSFHSSAGKILTAAKVPPPPPLRTTSQLSGTTLPGAKPSEEVEGGGKREEPIYYQYPNQYNTVVTRADVHQEGGTGGSSVDEVDHVGSTLNLDLPPYPSPIGSAIHSRQASGEEFPPPPPPLDLSVLEEEDDVIGGTTSGDQPGTLLAQLQSKRQEILSTSQESGTTSTPIGSTKITGGDTWLKELQAKQAALRLMKKNNQEATSGGVDIGPNQKYCDGRVGGTGVNSSVRDLATRFESTSIQNQHPVTQNQHPVVQSQLSNPQSQYPAAVTGQNQHPAPQNQHPMLQNQHPAPANVQNQYPVSQNQHPVLQNQHPAHQNQHPAAATIQNQHPALQNQYPVPHNQHPAPVTGQNQHPRPVNNIQAPYVDQNQHPAHFYAQNQHPGYNQLPAPDVDPAEPCGRTKKKSVSFCDQVILVEEQEDDSYIPNPILERVLRSAMNKPETAAIRQEVMALSRQARSEDVDYNCNSPDVCSECPDQHPYYQQRPLDVEQDPVYVSRRNSVDNLLADQQLRQSPYQRIPTNSPAYNKQSPIYGTNQHAPYPNQHPPNRQYYQPSPQNTTTRQSPSLYQQQPYYQPYYQHPPSPSPSYQHPGYPQQRNSPSCQIYQKLPPPQQPCEGPAYSPYQHVPLTQTTPTLPYQHVPLTQTTPTLPYQHVPLTQTTPTSPYQHVPLSQTTPTSPYQHVPLTQATPTSPYQQVPYNPHTTPTDGSAYQRVPHPHPGHAQYQQQQQQHVMPPRQQINNNMASNNNNNNNCKKSVSFEAGTKGGSLVGGAVSPTPKAVVTPIIVNNSANKTKCNLCRKKAVVSVNLYCTDCEFYMSRFKPKR